MKGRRELTPEERAEAASIIVGAALIGILLCLCAAVCLCIVL